MQTTRTNESEEQVGTKEETKLDFAISDGYVELKSDDLEIENGHIVLKNQIIQIKIVPTLWNVTMGSKDNMSKKSVNINLREGNVKN